MTIIFIWWRIEWELVVNHQWLGDCTKYVQVSESVFIAKLVLQYFPPKSDGKFDGIYIGNTCL